MGACFGGDCVLGILLWAMAVTGPAMPFADLRFLKQRMAMNGEVRVVCLATQKKSDRHAETLDWWPPALVAAQPPPPPSSAARVQTQKGYWRRDNTPLIVRSTKVVLVSSGNSRSKEVKSQPLVKELSPGGLPLEVAPVT